MKINLATEATLQRCSYKTTRTIRNLKIKEKINIFNLSGAGLHFIHSTVNNFLRHRASNHD